MISSSLRVRCLNQVAREFSEGSVKSWREWVNKAKTFEKAKPVHLQMYAEDRRVKRAVDVALEKKGEAVLKIVREEIGKSMVCTASEEMKYIEVSTLERIERCLGGQKGGEDDG